VWRPITAADDSHQELQFSNPEKRPKSE